MHAARQSRYLERAKSSAPKVTHRPMTQAAVEAKDAIEPEVVSGGKDRDETSTKDVQRCSGCGVELPRWTRVGPRPGRRRQSGGRHRAARPPRGPP